MITIISSILQWNILMPMKVHDTHGLNIGGAIQKMILHKLHCYLSDFHSLYHIQKQDVWSIISQLECSSDAFQPIISIPLSKAH